MLIDDDEEKIQKKWLKIENKKKILEMIEGYYEEFVNYLRSYDINSLSEEEVSNRFKLIQSYIEEYKMNFYENTHFPEKKLDNDFYSVREKTSSYLQKEFKTSEREPSFTLRNKESYLSPEGSFSNFIKFYDRNNIQNEFKL